MFLGRNKNIPNPLTSNVYWYTRSRHTNGSLSLATCGKVDLASSKDSLQASLAAISQSTGRFLEFGGFTKPT